MSTWHVGCAGLPCARERYVSALNLVELDLRPPAPPTKSLQRWRQDAPEGFVHAVVAPPALYGDRDFPLRDEATTATELDRLSTAAGQLGAAVVVLRTPMAIAPGSAALERFKALLARATARFRRVVWDPAGLWEPEGAVRVAHPLGALVVTDPLHDEPTGEKVAYARLRGLGIDRRYHTGMLEDLASRLEGLDEVFVVFASEGAWREARALSRLVGTLTTAPDADDLDDEEDDDNGAGDDSDDDEEDGDPR
ncbi:MAG: DUF72 domain-containing protein [Deltaproteobacteria bacterium]|nr:DUF72 domain-containing protein [Deltaproteobacteria bacterium]